MAVNLDSYFKKYYPSPKEPSYTHASDKRVVISLNVMPKDTATLPEELMIVMEKALELGVPVQVQFEITPYTLAHLTENTVLFMYHCSIKSVKARIKPGTKEFVEAEEKYLDHIINGTEDADQEKERAMKRIMKVKKELEANRFTGLEIE